MILEPLGTAPTRPLCIRPEPEHTSEASLPALQGWLTENRALFDAKLIEHGAVLFRGFHIQHPQDFEAVARAVDPELRNDYLGTSPRNAVTPYVFSASELPPVYPIPQHIEMSFLPEPPRKLFFYCHIEPEHDGETPLCDFRRVYADLDPAVRDEFEKRGIRNIRNYNGPESGGRFDLWKLKRWDEMFLTTDRAKVESICKAQGLTPEWLPGGKLRLVNTQKAFRTHPVTGVKVWSNHLQVFHLAAAALEYKRIARRQKSTRAKSFRLLTSTLTEIKRRTMNPEDQAMHCTYGDGGQIPDSVVAHVVDVIWKNLSINAWRKGDVVAIDNFSTSHGRLPYRGPREILVAWTSGLRDAATV